jgi:hypothetical protein
MGPARSPNFFCHFATFFLMCIFQTGKPVKILSKVSHQGMSLNTQLPVWSLTKKCLLLNIKWFAFATFVFLKNIFFVWQIYLLFKLRENWNSLNSKIAAPRLQWNEYITQCSTRMRREFE